MAEDSEQNCDLNRSYDCVFRTPSEFVRASIMAFSDYGDLEALDP